MLFLARENIKGKIVISTNMTISDDKIYRSLLKNSDVIICCLDKWDKVDYESIRRGADFEKVISNIENLLSIRKKWKDGSEVVIKALDIDPYSKESLSFNKYWQEKGAKTMIAWKNDWAGTFPELMNNLNIPAPETQDRTACADLWFKIVINWQGSIQLCCFDWSNSFPIGTIHDSDWLYKTWQSKILIEARKTHLQGDFSKIPICKKCKTWGKKEEHTAYLNLNEDNYFLVF